MGDWKFEAEISLREKMPEEARAGGFSGDLSGTLRETPLHVSYYSFLHQSNTEKMICSQAEHPPARATT